nr:immunoglobulin heavy chain junction region [Mus musculus]MBK4187257.1 immunoglobulin heavy chain junction region [Mus musculus]MBK4196247.1 immunoglobulin heavy chain junction region [Mus musculus]
CAREEVVAGAMDYW